jgi:hypothetical protein
MNLENYRRGEIYEKKIHGIYLSCNPRSNTIFGSTVTYTAENIHEINKTGLPDHPIAIKTTDIIILLMTVLMIFFFTIKVF